VLPPLSRQDAAQSTTFGLATTKAPEIGHSGRCSSTNRLTLQPAQFGRLQQARAAVAPSGKGGVRAAARISSGFGEFQEPATAPGDSRFRVARGIFAPTRRDPDRAEDTHRRLSSSLVVRLCGTTAEVAILSGWHQPGRAVSRQYPEQTSGRLNSAHQ
jgi:hypothetical protein